ncbi:CDP-glycerol glycerophosphotransferase family protein [Rarobacter incanus]|uniref:CDP-glycerol glycerophosphotransferase family protein n=1 Tax=Rarobacter incanus TaxID=153494 RepID=UPI001477268E|nr:CDP-glycerol glycerophosphotransferase family protein [Rarobacter incanus]
MPNPIHAIREAGAATASRLAAATRRNPRIRALLARARESALKLRDDVVPVEIDKDLVFFASFSGRSVGGSPLAVFLELANDGSRADLRFVWAVRDRAEALRQHPYLDSPRVSLVQYGSRRCAAAMRRAGVWVSSTTLPEHIRLRPGQQYIQTWHGTPFKRLGRDIAGTSAGANGHDFARRYARDAARMSILVSGSQFTDRVFTTAFSLDTMGNERILAHTGNPRNDPLVRVADATPAQARAARDAARAKLGLPRDGALVLYAPTWRDDMPATSRGYRFTVPLDVKALRAAWGNDVSFIFRAHYLMAAAWDLDGLEGIVYDRSAADDVNDVMVAADALITDYSSIFFDYALLQRPMYFFAPDLQHYAQVSRGLYFPPEQLPGPVATTMDELASCTAPDQAGRTDTSAFTREFATYERGTASRQIIERVWPR